MSDNQKGNLQSVKVITIAVGGATCSGKTTLAKHLRSCLYDSFIIHQDDFAPPQELVPVHPQYNVQDWDDAPGAIDWPRFVDFLEHIKRSGVLPSTHKSHDHLNENKQVPVAESITAHWRRESERISKEHQEKHGARLVWAIVDGFLMYWNKACFCFIVLLPFRPERLHLTVHQKAIDQLDIRVFLRVPHDVLKQRRHERHGYHTAVQSDPEGTLWRDPPEYWEQIVYPAYFRAHTDLFEGGDVEHGKPTDKVPELLLFEGLQTNMESTLTVVMEKVIEVT
ncbi:P-loop containing nucleoside triphosphate hydrolase protein, partial [Gautieria morchelliformis]